MKRAVRILLAVVPLLVLITVPSWAVTKVFTFSGTATFACPDFACTDFVVAIANVTSTGGDWAEVPNTRTSSHKKADCTWPDAGQTVSVEIDFGGIANATDKGTITLVSTASKVVDGQLVKCAQTKVVTLDGTSAVAQVINFDLKDVVPGPNKVLMVLLALGLLGSGTWVVRSHSLRAA